MRPKSEIYTPKRDDQHPHPFHMRSPPPGAAMDHGTSKQAQHEGPTRRTPFRSTFQAKNKNYVVRIVCGFVVCSQPLAFSVTGHNRQNTINNPETFEEFTFFCFFFIAVDDI